MILAIDCDLRTSYGVTDTGWSARGPSPLDLHWQLPSEAQLTKYDAVLFEIASPVSFIRGVAGNAAMSQLAKWAIWNAAQAALLHRSMKNFGIPMFVSPSNKWTKGYTEKQRHLIAKCVQKKKDLRECEAMIFMYKADPTQWLPLPQYLAAL